MFGLGPTTDGIKAILHGMRAHTSNEKLQMFGFEELGMLAFRNDDHKVKIAEQGGIQAILNGMRAHTSHNRVQRQGCAVLGLLIFHHDDKIVEQAVQEVLSDAMTAHPDDEVIRKTAVRVLEDLAKR